MNIHKNARLTAHGRERIVKLVLGGQIASTCDLAIRPQDDYRNPVNGCEQTWSNATKNTRFHGVFRVAVPLITVWLQVRVLPGAT